MYLVVRILTLSEHICVYSKKPLNIFQLHRITDFQEFLYLHHLHISCQYLYFLLSVLMGTSRQFGDVWVTAGVQSGHVDGNATMVKVVMF